MPPHRPSIVNKARLAAVAVLIVAIAFVVGSRKLRVAYHDWRMQRNHEIFFGQPGGVLSADDHLEAFEHHRDQLVALGAVDLHEFYLAHITMPSPEATHFTRWLLRESKVPCIYWLSTPQPAPPQPLRLTVWCYPNQSAAWQQLLKDRDVPNYAEKFMAASPS